MPSQPRFETLDNSHARQPAEKPKLDLLNLIDTITADDIRAAIQQLDDAHLLVTEEYKRKRRQLEAMGEAHFANVVKRTPTNQERQTLTVMRRAPSCTPAQLGEALGIDAKAAQNKLHRLCRLGYAKRIGFGKYAPVEAK